MSEHSRRPGNLGMPFVQRVLYQFREKGVLRTLTIILHRLYDCHFDLRYGTDTAIDASPEKSTAENIAADGGFPYQPTMAIPFNRLMDRLNLPSESVLVDFGCGKGRVMILAALRGIKKAVGVEYDAELCRIARKNVEIMENRLNRKLNISVIDRDVREYDIEPDQNVFFFYNPFDDAILSRVVDNIKESLSRHPRNIYLLYYNPLFSDTLEAEFKLEKRYHIAGEECLLYVNPEQG